MQRIATIGGLLASLILIVLGIASVVIGAKGHSDVRDSIADERIVCTPDMTPEAIAESAEVAGVEVPDCSVADEEVDTGDDARCFGEYLRIHALEATGGQTYAEMPRFIDAQGNPTEDESEAATDPESGEAAENPQREIWVSGTAFSTALNTSYFAEQVARFGIVMGIAMILIGIGFLALIWFGGLRPVRTGANRS